MTIELELQMATTAKTIPHPSQFREWVSVTLSKRVETAELTIRIVDEDESAQLNQKFRGKTGSTNVLSFPYVPLPGVPSRFLGDIVICAPKVMSELSEQNKSLLAYWAHIVVHGTLHLLGYDHEKMEDATEMEKIETEILTSMGFDAPYGE